MSIILQFQDASQLSKEAISLEDLPRVWAARSSVLYFMPVRPSPD
jgi:hypothetical protein